MLRALNTAALGMNAQQRNVDNIANNMANASTNGYKQTRLVFHDLIYQNIQTGGQNEAEGNAAPASLQIGHGAAPVASVRDFRQGGLKQTGNNLDVAINGEGFLQIRRPDGSIAYTRDGNLNLDAEGNIVTHSGLMLEPDLNVPPEATNIRISQDGVVTAEFEGDPVGVELGQIELARFANAGGLKPIGGNLFEQTAASGPPTIATPGQDGMGLVRQGFLETSNVNIVREMTNLIEAQRAYEINSKMVTTTEDMLQIANNLKR